MRAPGRFILSKSACARWTRALASFLPVMRRLLRRTPALGAAACSSSRASVAGCGVVKCRLPALAALCVALAAVPCAALATAGFFQNGYGLKAKGMGGAAAAFPQDALVAATNPAGMVWVGNRLDIGVEQFDADRGSTISGNNMGLSGSRDANGIRRFAVAELGFNRMLGQDWSLGVAVFANGGMTGYTDNPLTALNGSSPAGMNFKQINVAPTLAMKLGDMHSIGLSVTLVYQQLAVTGMEHFDDAIFSAFPGSVTNRGKDHASGIGWRTGWLGHVTPDLSLAVAYQPRTRMRKFDRYKGLLADGGNFDVPQHYVLGAALRLTSALTAVADIQRIDFSGARSLGNRADCFLAVSCRLGTPAGPGSGWRDATVVKLGLAYAVTPTLVLRAGVTQLRQPIPSSQTLLNVFAPAVSERHVSIGATWQVGASSELTAYYMQSAENTVTGSASIPPGFPPGGVGGGEADLRMKQSALGIAWGWRL